MFFVDPVETAGPGDRRHPTAGPAGRAVGAGGCRPGGNPPAHDRCGAAGGTS